MLKTIVSQGSAKVRAGFQGKLISFLHIRQVPYLTSLREREGGKLPRWLC